MRDWPAHLTPVERYEAPLYGQVSSSEDRLTLTAPDGVAAIFTLPRRAERLQLIIINESDGPLLVRPFQRVPRTAGIPLVGYGDMLIVDAKHDHDLVIAQWHFNGAFDVTTIVRYIETYRDTQRDYGA